MDIGKSKTSKASASPVPQIPAEQAFELRYGASVRGDQVHFQVWAPAAKTVLVQFEDGRTCWLQPGAEGNFEATLAAAAGDRYFYRIDGQKPVPDPVSRLLPEGVHGPSEIVDPNAFSWTDLNWHGLPLNDYIIYELHVGTFTPQGTFSGVVDRLDYLKQLGITVIELMPVAAFPGRRNWGYDGVSPYAVQTSYGGPQELKRLVDAAHRAGLAVILDVVYNHLGNEGNYLSLFGPYFTDRHETPWGVAINYDGRDSSGVRHYFVENALYWMGEYHLDGLRLDAIQTIKDDSKYHIVEEIRDRVKALAETQAREICVIAETDENESRLVRPKATGGFALDGIWSDDFHHSVHTVLTGEDSGYYQDFGKLNQLGRALGEGFVFQGEYFKFWKAHRGTSAKDLPLPAHVICIQNHDQVGNRAQGERLQHLVPNGAHRLAAALLLLAPETPLLFMGEEYAEPAPFQFFTDYGDPVLQDAVREGRRHEFREFSWTEVPDPQAPGTFERSRLNWHLATNENATLQWYRRLIALRKRCVTGSDRTCRAQVDGNRLTLQIPAIEPQIVVRAALPGADTDRQPIGPEWSLALESAEDGYSVSVFGRDGAANAGRPAGGS